MEKTEKYFNIIEINVTSHIHGIHSWIGRRTHSHTLTNNLLHIVQRISTVSLRPMNQHHYIYCYTTLHGEEISVQY